MKIVLLAREGARTGQAGGIATYTWMMACALADQGHKVCVVAQRPPDPAPTIDHPGVTVRWIQPPPFCHRVPRRLPAVLYYIGAYSLSVAQVLADMIAREGVDIVESPEWRVEALAYSYRPAAAPIVLRLHTPRFVERKVNGRWRGVGDAILEHAEVRLARRVVHLSAPSASLATVAAHTWRLPLERITVIPNPIDSAFFAPAEDTARNDVVARTPSCGSPAESSTILYVGRLERRKGVDLLIEALPAVVAMCPDARLEFVGSVGAGGIRAALVARAEALGVADRVTFQGKLDPAAVRDRYRRAAVCVVPSRYEAFGYTCLEAMACGRPVVATNTGGLSEILAPGDCGALVPPEDPAALAAAIIQVLLRPDMGAAWGCNARRRVERVYAADAVARQMSALYEEVIARYRAHHER